VEFIDTHAHLYLPQFDEDRPAMIARAMEQSVGRFFLPNIDLETLPVMNKMCDDYPGICFPMIGLHPSDVKENFKEVLHEMEKVLDDKRYIAIGETGIDMYWDKTTLPLQQESFRIQIQWAKDTGRPIVIHARDSFDEIFAILDEVNDADLKGVFHCFTGTLDQAKKIMGYGGFMMGIGGVLTFQNSGLDKVVPHIPHEFLVLETDSPFLAPKPHRGKRNESAYVRIVAEKLSEVLGISLEEVAQFTSANARALFLPSINS
jgi:TatD DNase family protein